MHPLTLWLSQVACAVITSPEDPGEESFQEAGEAAGWGGQGGGFMLRRHRRGLLPVQTTTHHQETGQEHPYGFLRSLYLLSVKANVLCTRLYPP